MILYTASWCKPCDTLKTKLKENNLLNKVEVILIDDLVQELKNNIGLRSIPTLKTRDGLVTNIDVIYSTIEEASDETK